LKEAEEEYQSFLADEAMDIQAMAHQSTTVVAMPIGEGAPQVRESRPKYFIIVIRILVIVKILFF
jgi:mannose-6-phosphate isomerase-like protein (cupin superfamily)